MKKRMKRLIAFLTAISLCTGTAYADSGTEEMLTERVQTKAASLEELTEAPREAPKESLTEAPTEAPAEALTEAPIEAPAEAPAEAPTEAPTEASTEAPTEAPAEAPTEAPAEAPTEALTGAPTEVTTQAASEISTEAETECATEEQTESSQTELPEKTRAGNKKETVKTEKEPEKNREAVIVKDEGGTVLIQREIKGPKELTCAEHTWPVDYEEGVYRVRVPEDTQGIQIIVPDQEKGEKISLTGWNGYLAEVNHTWLLCPDDPMEETFTTEGNIYSVNLEKYTLDLEQITLEQLAVYGTLDAEASYAEIFVYSAERSQVLLVEFVADETQTEDISESIVQTETDTEYDTECVTEEVSEEVKESESETGLYLELTEEAEEEVMTLAASASDIEKSYSAAGNNLAASAEKSTPAVGSINGEWHILGLVRSGQSVDEEVYDKYLENVINTVKESDGVLHKKKYTEYSRVILALTALGEDVTDVGGYNLLEPLADFDQTVWQGINGAIFALIALDSHDYEIPTAAAGKTQTTRAKLINHILSQEVSGGGWDLSGRSADPDITGMAIQALAPYYNRDTAVKNAVDRAVKKLSSLQNKNGGYGSSGSESSESCSQVIVALTALGIDPNTDPRFTKNGKSVVDALLSFSEKDGSFAHLLDEGSNPMATEQAYYALTSYQRFQNGKTSLYDMSDVVLKSDYKKAENVEELIKALPGTITLEEQVQVQTAFSSYNKLTELQKSLITEASYTKLQAAVKALEELDVEVESEEQTETDTEETEAITEKDPNAENGNSGNAGTDKNPSGTNKNPSAANKKPSGSTKKVNLVSSSKRTGATSTGASGSAKTGSTTTGKGTGTETESESETEQFSGKKTGSTQLSQAAKNVIKEIGSLLGTSKAAMKLPEEASEYTDAQVDSILEIYRSYAKLTETEKEAVRQNKKYEEYLTILDKLKAANHYDEVTDTDLRENEEEILPWYIQMEVTPVLIEENCAAAVREALKGQGALLTLTDIHLIDLFEGGAWQPEDMVRVRIAETGQESFENLAVVHMKEDGGMEFIEACISGDYLEFDTDHFSRFGIVGYNGAMEELMEDKKDEIYWIYLAPGAGAAVLLLLLLILRAAGSKKKKGVKNSER